MGGGGGIAGDLGGVRRVGGGDSGRSWGSNPALPGQVLPVT